MFECLIFAESQKQQLILYVIRCVNVIFRGICLIFRYVRKNCEKRLLASYSSVRPSVRPSVRACLRAFTWNNCVTAERIKKNWVSKTCRENSISIKIRQEWRVFCIMMCMFMTVSRWIFLRMRNFSDKISRKTNFFRQLYCL
jgi:hypothetical protein